MVRLSEASDVRRQLFVDVLEGRWRLDTGHDRERQAVSLHKMRPKVRNAGLSACVLECRQACVLVCTCKAVGMEKVKKKKLRLGTFAYNRTGRRILHHQTGVSPN